MKYNSIIGSGFNRWSQGSYTPGQIQAINDFDSLFILLSGSYRSGKTELLARTIIRHLVLFPNSKGGVFRAHLASLKKSTLLTILELIHPSWLLNGDEGWSNTDLVAKFINGSKLSFIGADFPDRLGSIELTIAGIDEASEVGTEAITMIQGRLSGSLEIPKNFDKLPLESQKYIKGTLDIRQTILACNPKSTSHHLYETFVKDPKPGHKIYTSNSIANINLPENYLIQNLSAYIKDNKSLDWVKEQISLIRSGSVDFNGLHLKPYLTPLGQRNLLGLWVALEGAIYSLDESRHYLDTVPDDWKPTGENHAGVDFGFHNPRIVILSEYRNASGDPCFATTGYWHMIQGQGSTEDDMLSALDSLKWGRCYMPHDRPDILKKARQRFGVSSIRRAKTKVFDGISTVASFINQGRLVFLKAPNSELFWDEMTGYEWKQNKEKDFIDEPVKKDDHYPDSLRYPLHSMFYNKGLTTKELT